MMAKDRKKDLEEQIKEFSILAKAFGETGQKIILLQKIFTLLNTSFCLHELLDKILDCIVEVIEVEAGSILLFDKEKNDLYFEAAKGNKAKEVMQFRLKIGEGIAGSVFLSQEPITVSEVAKDKRFKKEISEKIGLETKSIACVPIVLMNKSIGVIEVINKRNNDIFSASDQEILTMAAYYTAKIIQNTKIIENLKKKIKSKKEGGNSEH
ncbi:MAG: GAF domain-containing protein [bacterium]|nr:GAF domain-containing protein [bacterium]